MPKESSIENAEVPGKLAASTDVTTRGVAKYPVQPVKLRAVIQGPASANHNQCDRHMAPPSVKFPLSHFDANLKGS